MSRSLRALLGVTLPVLTIAIFVILLAFSLLRLSEIERDTRIEASQNMLWVISRAHISSLELGQAVAESTVADPDRTQIKLHYNIFLSRLALLDDGPQRRQMQALGAVAALDALRADLPLLETLVMADDPTALRQIRAVLLPYNQALVQAANKAMVAEWDELGARLDTTRKQLWQIIISMICISLAGTVLCAHFLLILRDARRRTRLLDKEKAFSQLLIGSSGEGIIAVDLQRRCTVWNEAAKRLFGPDPGRSTGMRLDEISGFFQVGKVSSVIDNALAGQAGSLFDQPFFLPDRDEPFYVDLRCFTLRDGERIMGAILLASDVTERRAAQREIASHRDHLEQLVQARTQELDAALTREREASELYQNFGTMVSHQFRTPLAIVDSALQRLIRRRDQLTPQEVLERAGDARAAITRLVRLVESTLDAARLDAGQIEIRSVACDLGALVMELCARQEGDNGERKINVTLPGNMLLVACCDPIHAEHILTNLVSNAVKYSPPETPVSISFAGDDEQITCIVSNICTAEGAFAEKALFDRYYRGSNTDGRPGIGVGLYMARMLARLQGGDVELQAAPPGQVRLAMLLPRSRAAMPSQVKTQHDKELA